MSKVILSVSMAALVAVGLAGVAQAGPTAICGDGVVEGPEFCDDSNTVSGDGCSSACQFEICGDGVVDPVSEECDTGALCEDNSTDCTEVSTPGSPGGPNDPGGLCSVDCAPRADVGDGCDDACQFECGNGALNTGEECDDGNRVDGDGCDANCINEVCGNGVLQSGEECDDGNTVDGDGCSSTCQLECFPQDKAQQKCITTLNKGDAKVKKARSKIVSGCLKDAAKGVTTPDFATCITSDPKGKAAKAAAKTCSSETKKCTTMPSFGYTDCATVNMAAEEEATELAVNIFGATQPVAKATDKDGAKCQKDVQKNTAKLLDTVVKEALKAKKNALKGKNVTACSPDGVGTGVELGEAISAALTSSSKITKTVGKVTAGKKCAGADPATLFAGTACPTTSLTDFLTCAAQQAICRAVDNINQADGLSIDASAVAGGTCL